MATIDSSIQRVQKLVGNHKLVKDDYVRSFINTRHSDLLESFDWSRRRQEIAITLQVDKQAGTVNVINGSPTVIGIGTAWTQSDVGRYMRVGADIGSQYVVKSVQLATQLTLGDLNGTSIGFPGSSANGLSYLMYTRFYSLGAGIEQIQNPLKGYYPIYECSVEWLDERDPTRFGLSTYPNMFARAPRDMSGTNDIVRIELYPRASQAQIVTINVQKGHTDLLPWMIPIVPSAPLEWFAAVDVCYGLAAWTKDLTWLQLADKYNAEGTDSLNREKAQDNAKFGQSTKVKDISGLTPLSNTDFGLTHDLGDS